MNVGTAMRCPHGGRIAAASWGMAQRRESAQYRWRLLGSGLLLTLLLATAIQLGNTVTGLRREVQDVARQNSNLEASRARLAMVWNTESSRQVILRRAQQELGLVVHEAPEAILVSTRGGGAGQTGWPRWLQRLGPVDPTPAALAAPDAR